MARMRRIQIVMDPELDDRLEAEAAARCVSKSALVREYVERQLPADSFDNGILALLELSKEFADVEPVDDIDEYLYGSLGKDA
jgi:Ribbon-helix-helix protein, copG family